MLKVVRALSRHQGTSSNKNYAYMQLQTLIAAATAAATFSISNNNHKNNNTMFTACDFNYKFHPSREDAEEEERNFQETLQHHKNQVEYYKQKWNYHNQSSRIPTVSWPTNIPDDDYVPGLMQDLKYCNRRTNVKDSNARFCQDLKFRIASYKMLQQSQPSSSDEHHDVQKEGLKMLKELADEGHGDGICGYATALNDGRAGLETNPQAAVSWWTHASRTLDHTQSNYELGVAFYTGEGVPEDEATAAHYFRKAADCGHAGASYMLGDCLLDGVGVERDRGEALEWLIISGELGHRGARSRVLAVLEKDEGKDFGEFTDASRQTLISEDENDVEGKDSENTFHSNTQHGSNPNGQVAPTSASASAPSHPVWEEGKKRDGVEQQYSLRPVTLEHRFTIGGGAGNPAVLGRRMSIVGESRRTQ